MKKIRDFYAPSVSEIARAAAHLRKLHNGGTDRNGMRVCWFDCRFYPADGQFYYGEYSDQHSYTPGNDYIYIPRACGTDYADSGETPAAVREKIISYIDAH